jgi:hypothetical protein
MKRGKWIPNGWTRRGWIRAINRRSVWCGRHFSYDMRDEYALAIRAIVVEMQGGQTYVRMDKVDAMYYDRVPVHLAIVIVWMDSYVEPYNG